MCTSQQVVTGVLGTQVAIVAIVCVLTDVFHTVLDGTGIPIITGLLFVDDVDATVFIVTNSVHRAFVAIDAWIGRVRALAVASITGIQGAIVIVRAVFGRVDTALCGITGVDRTCVGVVAGVQVLTAVVGIAGVCCAWILIIAGIEMTDAFARFRIARVHRTCVAIFAVLGRVGTTQCGITGFVGTKIAIVTIQGRERANVIHTSTNGAQVGVVALAVLSTRTRNRTVAHRDELATGLGRTTVHGAEVVIRTFGGRIQTSRIGIACFVGAKVVVIALGDGVGACTCQ